MYDVVIIGAGVIGCAIARELSRYQLNTLVLEKENDVCCGTSKANSAIIHAGFDAHPDKLKGKFNAPSNLLFDKLSKELDFPFKRNGSLVLCFSDDDLPALYSLKERGEKNGVPDLKILSGNEVRQLEPHVTNHVVAALYAPTSGIVCPFNMTIAFAENAYTNGVSFQFNTEVTSINKKDSLFYLSTPSEIIQTKLVINAAGVYSDKVCHMISNEPFTIKPRRGEYTLFDKYAGSLVSHTLFQLPSKLGKGVLVTPTVDGNLLIGPNAVDQTDKSYLDTSRNGLDEIIEKALLSVDSLPTQQVITSFSGLRARSDKDDFILGETSDVSYFINAASIESPGLTSAPLISLHIAQLVCDKLNPPLNPSFNPVRQGIPRFNELPGETKHQLLATNPLYAKIVCRCESITEAEILDAINRPLGATDLDGIKRRTRAGAGRCQSGFCLIRNMELLSENLHASLIDITKFGKKSSYLLGHIKENL